MDSEQRKTQFFRKKRSFFCIPFPFLHGIFLENALSFLFDRGIRGNILDSFNQIACTQPMTILHATGWEMLGKLSSDSIVSRL